MRELVEDIAARGDAAVAEAARRFDGVDTAPDAWQATADELAAAEAALDPVLRTALLDAIERAAAFHRAQRPADLVWTDRPGVRLVQRFVPLRRPACTPPASAPTPPAWS